MDLDQDLSGDVGITVLSAMDVLRADLTTIRDASE
jgi:hypothetical protein